MMEFETRLSTDELVRLSTLRALLVNGQAQQAREAAGLSLGEVARACRVTTGTVARWESGENRACTRRALCYLDLIEGLSDA